MYLFSILTPTYNRAHTLRRVYESLCHQPPELFEWIVVDDGSTDETQILLCELKKISQFHIQTITQKNGGKHRAHNAGIKYATGILTIVLDSDDELSPNALRLLENEWLDISKKDIKVIAGILGHSVSSSTGNIIGLNYPTHIIDGRLLELVASKKLVGEKLPCYQTEILKMHPFPECFGSNEVVPEGTVWMKISYLYKVRCLNEVVRVYHSDIEDKNALMNSYKSPGSNAWGSMQYCIVVLGLLDSVFPKYVLFFLKMSVNCTRYVLHSKSGISTPYRHLRGFMPIFLWLIGIPLGLIVWIKDQIHIKARAFK